MKPFQHYRPEKKNEIPIGAMINAFGRVKPDVDSFFDSDGPLARTFGDKYTRRSGQINLAQMVWRSLTQRLTLMAEAETGSGKSFAMLVPAILWALEGNRTVVVSTATIALQDQYCLKDLPMLQKAFALHGMEFRFSKGQGRSNYYCLDSPGAGDEFHSWNEQINDWLMDTQTGDFNELPFDIKNPQLAKLYEGNRADAEDCPGQKKCPMGDQCWFYQAKQRQEGCHVIVVNHALLALNDRLEGLILPAYHALLVDEAHQLERYVRSAWEATLSAKRCYKLGAKLAKAGLDGQETLDQIGKTMGEIFEQYLEPFRDAPTVEWHAKKWPEARWAEFFDGADTRLFELVDDLAGLVEEVPKAGPISSGIFDLRKDMARVGAADQAARWFERDKRKQAALKISPVDVSRECARLYKVPTTLTSATMAIGHSYDFAAQELGVSSPLEMPPLKSPFNWDRNCLYVYPRRGTLLESDLKGRQGETSRQTAQRWATRIAGPIKSMLRASSGRAFVLFTSRAVMEAAYDLVAPHCREMDWTVLIQGEFSKGETIARFKAGCSPVLFATSSFWEGVDVPGNQLSVVIIDKLPWPNPSNPIEKAKSDLLGFAGYNVPMVVRSLKQGVGRLIRTEKDRGIVYILDPRVHKYAHNIMVHLPGQAVEALDEGRKNPSISQFLDGSGPRPFDTELEEWAASGLRCLSDLDGDRASEDNGVGFSAADTEFGNSLAAQLVDRGLTDRQWALATTMLRKYHKQIGKPPEVKLDLVEPTDEEAA